MHESEYLGTLLQFRQRLLDAGTLPFSRRATINWRLGARLAFLFNAARKNRQDNQDWKKSHYNSGNPPTQVVFGVRAI